MKKSCEWWLFIEFKFFEFPNKAWCQQIVSWFVRQTEIIIGPPQNLLMISKHAKGDQSTLYIIILEQILR